MASDGRSGGGGDGEIVFKLPRGGTVVMTKLGPVQFGMPPETIKDSMVLGLGIPAFFVVPEERFVKKFGPRQGVNVAEFEFPAYCNFFFKGKRVNLVVDSDDVQDRIQRVFQETLLGPEKWDSEVDFDPSFPVESRPDLSKELYYFRKFGDSLISVDMLLAFSTFDQRSAKVVLSNEDGSETVTIEKTSTQYVLFDHAQEEIARVSKEVYMPPPPKMVSSTKVFCPPLFGVTVLGSSHGFDPNGQTSGYVLWMNRRGIMIDPPPNSSVLLQQNHIPPSLIDGIIVTHCHADHDAGTFQKILQEGKVTLMTTPTIHGCFIRKYAALSGLEENFLQNVFTFRPARIGESLQCRGGSLRFFYSLHSIPCIGFEAFFGGKSIVFSADHMNDPERIKQLCQDGVLSQGRRDFLLNFPWHRDLILHEAGVPPIHTPLETLSALPAEVKDKLYVVHVAADKVTPESGLRVAMPGVEHTLIVDGVKEPPFSKAQETLDLVSSVSMLSGLTVKHASEILACSQMETFEPGELIVRKGTKGSSFYVVMSGRCEVRVTKAKPSRRGSVHESHQEIAASLGETQNKVAAIGEEEEVKQDCASSGSASVEELNVGQLSLANVQLNQDVDRSQSCTSTSSVLTQAALEDMAVKTYCAGDCFGEQALIKKDAIRTADICAITGVTVLRFDGAHLKWMLQGTEVIARMNRLVKMRQHGSGIAINENSVLSLLSESQKTQLESVFERKVYKEGEHIWRANEPAQFAVLIKRGCVTSTPSTSYVQEHGDPGSDSARVRKFEKGAFLIDVDAILESGENDADLVTDCEVSVLVLYRQDLLTFFRQNPGFLLTVVHQKCFL